MKNLACLGLLATLTLASPAYADSCGGTLVEYKKIVAPNGTVLGQMQLYYNKNNGMNCAIVKHSDATWGKKLYGYASIVGCFNGEKCTKLEFNEPGSYDDGHYMYEVGPVRVSGKKDGKPRCVKLLAGMNSKVGREADSDTVNVESRPHCG